MVSITNDYLSWSLDMIHMIDMVGIEMLVENLNKMNESMVTVHANYISGNKKKMVRMMDYGLWLADNNPHSSTGENSRRPPSSPPSCKAYVYVAPNQTVTTA